MPASVQNPHDRPKTSRYIGSRTVGVSSVLSVAKRAVHQASQQDSRSEFQGNPSETPNFRVSDCFHRRIVYLISQVPRDGQSPRVYPRNI